MSTIIDLWGQDFSALLISSAPDTLPWLKSRLGSKADRWSIDAVSRFEAPARPLGDYALCMIDSANSLDDALTLSARLEGENTEAPLVLIVSSPEIAKAVDPGPIAVDAVLLRAPQPGEPEADADLMLRYFIGRKRGWTAGSDQVNFDPVTGLSRADQLAHVIDIAVRQAKRSNSFVALLAMSVRWLDDENTPVPATDALMSRFAERLGEVRRRSDFVCIDDQGRIFLVLVRLHTSREIEVATSRILNRLMDPFSDPKIGPRFARIAVGVSHTLAGQNNADDMLSQARRGMEQSDSAMGEPE